MAATTEIIDAKVSEALQTVESAPVAPPPQPAFTDAQRDRMQRELETYKAIGESKLAKEKSKLAKEKLRADTAARKARDDFGRQYALSRSRIMIVIALIQMLAGIVLLVLSSMTDDRILGSSRAVNGAIVSLNQEVDSWPSRFEAVSDLEEVDDAITAAERGLVKPLMSKSEELIGLAGKHWERIGSIFVLVSAAAPVSAILRLRKY